MTELINGQQTEFGSCNVWADPHLVMFPVSSSQANLRMSYWCQTPGRMLILKNKYIEVSVNVTTAPWWNEDVGQVFRRVLYIRHITFLV